MFSACILRGFITAAFHSIIRSALGLSLEHGERDNLSGSQNKERSMSSSGLDIGEEVRGFGGNSREKQCRNVKDVKTEQGNRVEEWKQIRGTTLSHQ